MLSGLWKHFWRLISLTGWTCYRSLCTQCGWQEGWSLILVIPFGAMALIGVMVDRMTGTGLWRVARIIIRKCLHFVLAPTFDLRDCEFEG